MLLALFVVLAFFVFQAGCGGGGGSGGTRSGGTPPGTYNIQVTGSVSSSLTHSATVALTVQ
jgi:hypothetical protein